MEILDLIKVAHKMMTVNLNIVMIVIAATLQQKDIMYKLIMEEHVK